LLKALFKSLTTHLVNTYYREICKVQLQACEPTAEQHQKMHDLRYIKMYADAAKAKAEYCHAPVQAVEMYEYAERLLAKYLIVSIENNLIRSLPTVFYIFWQFCLNKIKNPCILMIFKTLVHKHSCRYAYNTKRIL
jgi:hypothetical protein